MHVKSFKTACDTFRREECILFFCTHLASLPHFDIFNYLTPYITGNNDDQYISEDNARLLQSIYEDVSLILGKVTQGIKDNSPEPAQQAIDDGQTSTQETITTPEAPLEEGLDSDKGKLWDELMGDVDMGDFFDNMHEGEEEEREKFLKDPKKELQN